MCHNNIIMISLSLVLVLIFTISAKIIDGYFFSPNHLKLSLNTLAQHRPCGFSLHSTNKDAQREEQWKLQQEILARRKNKSKLKEYFENVEKKRNDLAIEAKSSKWASTKDGEDPITIWQQAKADGEYSTYYMMCNTSTIFYSFNAQKGKIKPLGYEPEPSKDSSKSGVNIVIPIYTVV